MNAPANTSARKMFIERGLERLLSPKARYRIERIILTISILSYLIHLLLIFLVSRGVLHPVSGLLTSPISAIYTPFSFILVYEVYLLIYYLPKSTSFYIGKQYEIITLIIIRRIFKDIGSLELLPNWFENENDLRFTYDAVTSLILFMLICLFYMQVLRKALACYSFGSWISTSVLNYQSGIYTSINLNQIFFDEFFTILIVVDVLLLLASLFYSDRFQSIMRNSGFVISTILIKLSFSVTGITNNLLIIGSVLFGLLVLIIFNLYTRKVAPLFAAQTKSATI
jgi:hypothetical protein